MPLYRHIDLYQKKSAIHDTSNHENENKQIPVPVKDSLPFISFHPEQQVKKYPDPRPCRNRRMHLDGEHISKQKL